LVTDLRNALSRYGFVKVPHIVPDNVKDATRAEVLKLLEQHAERRDLLLKTTGNTPRFMSVVKSETIASDGHLIPTLYHDRAFVSMLESIASEPLHPCPSADEEFLITRQERKGDTHGWHWGDFSYALIWILETPALEVGGMLQCVPHTTWDKADPRIHQYLCDNPVATYGFVPGDIYFLRTDTTLHRTVPLSEDATRIILNMTWAADRDLRDDLKGDDRWWENTDASAVRRVD
jgi:hypothetical protein